MHIAELWASLILAHVSTLLVDGAKFIGTFSEQKPLRQQEQQQQTKQQQRTGEPTCEELRAMWIYSKRQSRAAENTNELPLYKDPFAYNIWEAYPSLETSSNYPEYSGPARSRGAGGAPIYGKLVHKAPPSHRFRNGMPDRKLTFQEFSRVFGTINNQSPSERRKVATYRIGGGPDIAPQSGSFQHLKDLILSERARELQEQRRQQELSSRAEVLKGIQKDARNVNLLSSGADNY